MEKDKIWEYFQTESSDIFIKSKARYKFLADQIKQISQTTAKVLNVGVGNGLFENIVINYGMDVYSLDPSERAIESLNENRGMNGKAKAGYLQDIPFENRYFDFVVVSEVLEHLADDALSSSLIEIDRVLVSGGYLLGTVPARENLNDQLVVCPDCGHKFHRWGHVQSFDKNRLTDLLSQKFQIEKISEKIFVTWHTLNWKGKVVAALKLTLHQLGNRGAGNSFYFLAKKI
ncbi:bifunctional 2-polyprenyl-6-hydroxyphenol methylase/3-demethylubiquinol 3-O-methyltransferase UbiG [[Phormidium] sp. ETS-05]|uniref:class I SAM-dependent methyltransferase n=1 Tax=[Phormidium] sp. ETS-05 TaxID=222819 RepID=UPI0018EF237C|nr:class I SAM-dependent methyltransferase [[Phormidium] sp. ETS-05]